MDAYAHSVSCFQIVTQKSTTCVTRIWYSVLVSVTVVPDRPVIVGLLCRLSTCLKIPNAGFMVFPFRSVGLGRIGVCNCLINYGAF